MVSNQGPCKLKYRLLEGTIKGIRGIFCFPYLKISIK